MSQGNPSCLRFSLEESIWFQKGQEVSELISISLDPDILIQDNDQYVTIQGALELSGEYKRNEMSMVADEDTIASPKFVHVIEEREEGICEFSHYFPVDITIPNNRIHNIHDIDVIVESFDYVLPERSCMKLTANLTITGLYGDLQHGPSIENQEIEEFEASYRSSPAAAQYNETETDTMDDPDEIIEIKVNDNENNEEENENEYFIPFEAEARKQPEINKIQEIGEQELLRESVSGLTDNGQTVRNADTSEERKQSERNNFVSEDAVQSEEQIEAAFNVKEKDDFDSEVEEEFVQSKEKPEILFAAYRNEEFPPPTANEIYKMTEITEREESSSEESSSFEENEEENTFQEEEKVEQKEKKKKSSKSKKKSMTLTEFFARKEEEEVAKLKVCIVQNGDTVNTIAEKYEIAVHQLLRVNHLEINQDVYEGQVLYIPVPVAP